MKKRKYRVKKRRVVFSKGPIHLVDCDVKMRSGTVLSRQILEHPGSVVIIPRVKKNQYLLIRQFRFATGNWIWEFPAGGVEEGETFSQAARRECVEETGFRPKKLKRITNFYPTPGISGERMFLYLADHLVPDFAEGDEDEEIEIRSYSAKAIRKMIKNNEIVDAKTIAGFLYVEAFLNGRQT